MLKLSFWQKYYTVICLFVQYVGSMQVLESMKALDFDTRTMITKYGQLSSHVALIC